MGGPSFSRGSVSMLRGFLWSMSGFRSFLTYLLFKISMTISIELYCLFTNTDKNRLMWCKISLWDIMKRKKKSRQYTCPYILLISINKTTNKNTYTLFWSLLRNIYSNNSYDNHFSIYSFEADNDIFHKNPNFWWKCLE